MPFTNFPNGITSQGIPIMAISPATITTAAAVTYTPAQLFNGLILRDPNGANRSDVTPTAASIVQYLRDNFLRGRSPAAGAWGVFTIRNTADAAETITVTAGTGVTLSGTMTIAQNYSRQFLMVITNPNPGSEAVTIYSLGTFQH